MDLIAVEEIVLCGPDLDASFTTWREAEKALLEVPAGTWPGTKYAYDVRWRNGAKASGCVYPLAGRHLDLSFAVGYDLEQQVRPGTMLNRSLSPQHIERALDTLRTCYLPGYRDHVAQLRQHFPWLLELVGGEAWLLARVSR